MAGDDNGRARSLAVLLSQQSRLAARIRQLLAAKRGLASSGKKSIAEESQELIDNWSAAELRGDKPAATSRLTTLLKEHHQIVEQILDILDRGRAR